MRIAILQTDTVSAPIQCEDWRDQANSDPITDVFEAIDKFVQSHGTAPDRLWVPIRTHHDLLRHPLLLDRVLQYRELLTLSRADLADIFDVKEYVVEGDV